MLSGYSDVELTLFARSPTKLTQMPANAQVVQGDVLDSGKLNDAIKGQDIVAASLTGGDLDAQAKSVIASMQATA